MVAYGRDDARGSSGLRLHACTFRDGWGFRRVGARRGARRGVASAGIPVVRDAGENFRQPAMGRTRVAGEFILGVHGRVGGGDPAAGGGGVGRIAVGGSGGGGLLRLRADGVGACNFNEVFSLHHVFLAALLWLAVAYGRTKESRWVWWGAAVFGLGMSNHHTILFFGGLLAIWPFLREPGEWLKPRRMTGLCGLFLLGFLPYFVLPVIAAGAPPVTWGDWTNWSGAWAHFTRSGLRIAATGGWRNHGDRRLRGAVGGVDDGAGKCARLGRSGARGRRDFLERAGGKSRARLGACSRRWPGMWSFSTTWRTCR